MTEAVADHRTCAGTTKSGEPCGSKALNADDLCFVHSRSPLQLAEHARKAGEASGAVRREAAKSFRERLRDEIEDRYEDYAGAFHRAVKHEDARIAYQASSAGLAEAYGKPIQPTREEGGMIFAHPLLTAEDAEKLNAKTNGSK